MSEVRRVIRGLKNAMRGEISVLNLVMNVVNWLVSISSEGGSFMWFNLFGLLPLTACENNKCWVFFYSNVYIFNSGLIDFVVLKKIIYPFSAFCTDSLKETLSALFS